MSARVSTRISIRWPPAPASEPTDTLVLSLGGHYVDLRIDTASGTIDWALAGERIVISEDPLKVEFTHPIDSHCAKPGDEDHESQADVGHFSKLPNGDDLEVGEMATPHLGGKVMPYEEIWRELPMPLDAPREGFSNGAQGWVLASNNDDANGEVKAFYARIGGYFLAVRRATMGPKGGQRYVYSAIREDFDASKRQWVEKYVVGPVEGVARITAATESLGEAGTVQNWAVGNTVAFGTDANCVVKAVSY